MVVLAHQITHLFSPQTQSDGQNSLRNQQSWLKV